MLKNTLVLYVRNLLPLFGVCITLTLVACDSSDPSSAAPSTIQGTQNSNTQDISSSTESESESESETETIPNEETVQGPISTATLEKSGFQNEIPLLQPQASLAVSYEFGKIVGYSLSPDGTGLAIVITENAFVDPLQVPQGDRIEIYNTASGDLVQTLKYTKLFNLFSHVFWSKSNRVHVFHRSFAETSYWVGWDVNTGAIVQEQSISHTEPCDDWGGMFFSTHYSNSDDVMYFIKNSENTQSHLCRLNLSDSSTSSVEINYEVAGSPIVSSDGSITAVKEDKYVNSIFSPKTHTYDTPNFLYRDEVYENEGILVMLGSGFRLTRYGFSGPLLLPSSNTLDIDSGGIRASESGNVLSGENPTSRDHVRFVTLPDGIVIGDVPEPRGSDDYRLISSGGEVAVIVEKITNYDNFRFDTYSLSNRTNYTALNP